jgi:3-phenylpropionate/trans-cinnamate dioxygenase ferredoxin subunit
MAFSKYKWYKFAEKETDIKWTPGAVAEVVINNKKLCIGRFQPPGAPATPGAPAPPHQYFGFAHTCPHAGAPLTDGYIDGACNVVCPVHQLKFNLRNGRDSNGEGYKLKTYPVEIRPDGIYIGIDEGGLFKWF